MPTIIDELVVRLGLDSKQLDANAPSSGRKLDDVEGKVSKVGKTSKDTAKGVDTLARSLAGLFAVIGGSMALRNFVEETIATNAELERFSKNIGLSVSDVSAWGNAVEGMGGNAKGLRGTMDMLSKSQTQLQLTGESSLIPYFSMMGISMADASGHARKVTDELADMASFAEGKDRTTMRNMFASMGIDEGTINLMLQGRKELELNLKRQKEYNAVTKEQAETAVKLQRAQVQLRQSLEALGRSLLQQAAPGLEKFMGWLQTFGSWLQQNMEFVKDFGIVLGSIAAGLGAIALATSPITLTVLGIVALAGAIALLWQDYQTWKRGGDSLIDWGKWESGIEAARKGIHALRDEIKGLAKDTYEWLQKQNEAFDKKHPGLSDKLGKAVFGANWKPQPGAAPSAVANSGILSMKIRAKAEAERVSQATGIPADILLAQWEHETGNFTNRGAKELNNLAGVNVPGGKGQDYRKFKSLDDFGDYYIHLMRPNGLYPGAAKARTPEDFAAALKAGGYFSDSTNNYAKGIRNFMSGVPGASSNLAAAGGAASGAGSTTNDNRTTVTTGPITVVTQATDAKGIADDLGGSINSFFTSQANSGAF